MIRNYFKTAIRNLGRHRFFSAINIFGLAMAMSICMGIIMLVADQMLYDQYNTKKDLIYRVNTFNVNDKLEVDEGSMVSSTSPMPLSEELEKYSGIDQIVRFKRGFGNGWIEFDNQDVNIPIGGYFADPGALDMFEFELQFGDPKTALNQPYSVVLTRKAADKLFPDENPVGKTIKVGDLGLYTVTGVIKKTENKTHIAFEALASMSSLISLDAQGKIKADKDNWHYFWSTWTYVQLKPGTDPNNIQTSLDKIFDEKIASDPDREATKMRMRLQSLTAMTPGPLVNNPIGPMLPSALMYILGGLAAVILITSCFNFTNLSIARSLTRAREIGVRKVNGASRLQVFAQFLSESLVVSFCALIFSLGLLMLVKPMILNLSFAKILRWDLASNVEVYLVFVGFAAFVGILAGIFPAVVLSGFKPVKVLKSLNNMRLFSKIGLRKTLLVSQFTLALVFILSVTVLYDQLDLFLHKDHGFKMDHQLMVRLNKTEAGPLKTEILKHSNIINVTAASHLPASGTSYGGDFRKPGEKDGTSLGYFLVDENYLENLEIPMVAGKFFDNASGESNKNFVVLNETATKAFHFESPIDAVGTQLTFERDSTPLTVIGVVKDYNHEELISKLDPLALLYRPAEWQLLQVKYSGTHEDAMKSVAEAWSKTNPGLKIDAKDMREEIQILYNTFFGDAVQVLGFVAFLAIVISCLGLLGMATYSTETRLKEVSVRKVLGSSDSALIYLLSKEFFMIILIAIALGVPSAYMINMMWLELLPYHVTVGVSAIAFGVSMLLLFAMITIGSQTYRATFVNPVDNLKSE